MKPIRLNHQLDATELIGVSNKVSKDHPEVTEKNSEIATLTGLRGIAAWWVVLYHFRTRIPCPDWMATILEHGFVAVDIFFVLSGYVLLHSFLRFGADPTFMSSLEFLWRRLVRVYPAHIFVLILYLSVPTAILCCSSMKDLGGRFTVPYFVMSVLLIQNWGLSNDLQWNVPAWSISTELAAYCALPLVVWSTRVWGGTVKRAYAGIVIISAVLASSFYAAGALSIEANISKFGLWRCLCEFALGAWLANAHSKRPESLTQPRWYLILLIASPLVGSLTDLYNYIFIPLASAALITALVQSQNAWWALALTNKGLLLAGRMSYSTYICHYLVKDWVQILVVESDKISHIPWLTYVGAVVAFTAFLYWAIELPSRRFGQRIAETVKRNLAERLMPSK